jgi:hypothetical protein
MLASVFNYILNRKPDKNGVTIENGVTVENGVTDDNGVTVENGVTDKNAVTVENAVTVKTTANGAPSLATSGDALVNLFYKAVRGINDDALFALADEAAKESMLNTLKIIAYVRDIRGGKGERDLGRALYQWLQQDPVREQHLIQNMWLYLDTYGRYDDMMHLPSSSKAYKEYIRLIGNQLKADLQKGDDESVSLVAKWIPSESSALNKRTNFTYRLARSMKIGMPELRKKFLTPLRTKIGLLEQKMCAGDWPAVDYEVLPSQALNRHTDAFKRNDIEKYTEYLNALKNKTAKVNVAALHPHEIVNKYMMNSNIIDELAEAQWKEILKNLPASDAVVLSDVSSSMLSNKGLPMLVSLTLGILLSSICTNPDFKHKVLTFESQPQFVQLSGESLANDVKTLKNAPWGGSTNICAAFDAILAYKGTEGSQLNSAESVSRLIIVSDMQFNAADSVYNETTYEAMKRKFEDANKTLPHVVFWNVNGEYDDFQTLASVPGVSMVSGFSVDILEAILHNDSITPYSTMMRVLNRERYSKIL